LYKDVPAYTTEDIKKIIDDRLVGHNEPVTANDGDGLLKKMDNATKSFLYEHSIMQPLSADYPADAIIDYQLNKVTGNSIDMFDNNLDLLAFP